MSHAAVQYVLLFLVRLNNSNRFQIYILTHSYSSRTFLALGVVIGIAKIVSQFSAYTSFSGY